MGMCKSCGNVVGSTELREGFCNDCFSPEKVEEKNKLNEENKRNETVNNRPVGVTIVGVLIMIGAIVLLAAMLFEFSRYGVSGLSLLLFIIALIQMFVSFGLLKGQKNARTVYTVIVILSTVINLLMQSHIDGKSLASIFMTLIFLGVLYMPKSEAFFSKDMNV